MSPGNRCASSEVGQDEPEVSPARSRLWWGAEGLENDWNCESSVPGCHWALIPAVRHCEDWHSIRLIGNLPEGVSEDFPEGSPASAVVLSGCDDWG